MPGETPVGPDAVPTPPESDTPAANTSAATTPEADTPAAGTPETNTGSSPVRSVLGRPSWPEASAVAAVLRTETVGGALLLAAAAIAPVWANSPWHESYQALRDIEFGPASWHLRLSLDAWAADGLLAVFFFVAGLELKREFLVGDLRDPAKAAVPVIAALGGVAVPALLYLATTAALGADAGAARGWAIPTATDIAFALAVLAVLGSHLPAGMRSFLLTLAVVDDLVAIAIIAVAYTADLQALPLLLALLPLAGFAVLVRLRIGYWWLLLPLAVLTWALVHASGVHATVAGVLLGLTVPVLPAQTARAASTIPAHVDVAHRFEHRLRPFSAGVAVPVFAFFAAGVTLVGGGVGAALTDPVAVAIMVALVLGKPLGVLLATGAAATFTRASLDESLNWRDLVGLSFLTGIGFTVSLLIGELAFGASSETEHARFAVLAGSLLAAIVATVLLRLRNRVYRELAELESRDVDGNAIPDVYETDRSTDPRLG